MKKTFLFMMTSLLFVTLYNCAGGGESDIPNATKSVSMKIDGVQKNFSKVEIVQMPWTDNGITRIDIHVKAMNPDDNSEYVQFGIGKGDIGDGQLWNFAYVKNGNEYTVDENSRLSSSTSINIEKRIVGTFSGAVAANGEIHVLSDGIFDIFYP